MKWGRRRREKEEREREREEVSVSVRWWSIIGRCGTNYEEDRDGYLHWIW
jgi:hypothetical protein